jgi:RNA polymerase sigma-70 factor (ECF subfamily)
VNSSDEALMAQVREGDLRRLAILFERHHRALFNFFVHMNGDPDLSDDLVQDVFFRILRYRASYDNRRPFSAWMYQIARNVNLDNARKRRSELQLAAEADEDERGPREPVSMTPDAERAASRREEVRLLRKALELLPEDKREILILSRFQNLKYHEIAAILGCEVGAVKVRVYRATRALGQIFFELAGEKAS